MLKALTPIAVFASIPLAGCAGLQFNKQPLDNSFTYYEPTPFAVIKIGADCSFSVDVVTLPGKQRSVRLKSGLGSSKLSLKVANGIITDIGQETDTKIPETITALVGAAKALGVGGAPLAPAAAPSCTPEVQMRPVIESEGKVTLGDIAFTAEAKPK